MMRFTKKIGMLVPAVVLGLAFMAVSTSAQVRVGVNFGRGYYHRPVVVRRYYSPVIPYGYYGYAPHNRYRSEKYYDRQSLNYAKHRLRNDENKYYADGYITSKEDKKLDSDYYKLQRDRRRVRNDW